MTGVQTCALPICSGFRSNSELGRLGVAFDHMAAALEERNLERDREAAERHRLMEQIDHERASLAGIVTSMSQGVVMVGPAETVSYASVRAGALLGIKSEALVGLHVDEALALIREANLVDRAAVPTWREIRVGISDYPSIEISYKTTPPRDLRLDFFPVTEIGRAHV